MLFACEHADEISIARALRQNGKDWPFAGLGHKMSRRSEG
jgi:hypothetical protein